MSEQDKNLMEQFMRFVGLLHRYQMHRFRSHGPFGNPHRGQGRVLSILKMQPEISQKELLYLLDMSKQSLGELLNKLERSGYVTRVPSEEDRRAANIRLTPEGAAAAGDIDTEQPDADNLFDCLDDEEQKKFSEYLDRLSAELEKQISDSGMDNTAFGRHMGGHFWGGHRGPVPGAEQFGPGYGGFDPRQRFGHGGPYGNGRHNEHHHGGYPHNGAHSDDEE